ncbi:PLP-dependent aspartate aminotransferase family protein, partial [Paenibacillus sepulcri]|nr:PLP-dependent aspartate aminotransferase family protein [Paenibacillus sepulcri]
MADKRKLRTLVTHDDHDERHHGAVHVPVYNTSLFTFASYEEMDRAGADPAGHYSYSRGNNPSVVELEERLAKLEDGEKARAFGSGMGAITATILSTVSAGDHIVCVDQVYGPAKVFMGDYLKRFNIGTTFVDGTSLEAVERAIGNHTKLLYLESPSSLLFELQDLEGCARLAEKYGLATVIDNTWSTPCFQNPLQYGIDLVVHSLTKYIGGHSDAMGGAVIGSGERIDRISGSELVLLGSIMHPQTASLI